MWYAWQGSNLRPSVPETDALVQLSYRRTICFQRLSGSQGYHLTHYCVHNSVRDRVEQPVSGYLGLPEGATFLVLTVTTLRGKPDYGILFVMRLASDRAALCQARFAPRSSNNSFSTERWQRPSSAQ